MKIEVDAFANLTPGTASGYTELSQPLGVAACDLSGVQPGPSAPVLSYRQLARLNRADQAAYQKSRTEVKNGNS